jgi:Trehalose utilisation
MRGFITALGVLALAASGVLADEAPIRLDVKDLPPRTLPEAVAERPVPDWLKTHLRIGHLPPGLGRMPEEFAKAGYNVIILNALRNWELVGPSAETYDPKEVARADRYLRDFVALAHGAGAKAVLYVGPVQVPYFDPEFVKTHPDWLRVNADGKPDAAPNFGNVRSGYTDWLLKQLAHVVREYKVDGFWFDGFAPGHLHTYDEATREAFKKFSGGKDIPGRFDVVHDPVARQYLAWHERCFLELSDRMRGAIRDVNPEAVIFANHSGNRTWYFPEADRGEYPLRYSGAIDVSSVELYWDVPGDALYHPFTYAFMQAVTRNRGATCWIQPSEHGISGVSSPVEIQLRGLEGAPWGVYPEFVESTGREEYLKLHVENVKAREKWWVGSEPVPYVGVVVSEQTRTLYGKAALPLYLAHALGAFRSLVEVHWPVRLLTEMDLEDADLRGVRVLVLPDTACLSDRSVEMIRRFVHAGGGLVASNESSLYGADFERRKDFALADLFKARYVSSIPVTLRTEALQLTLEKGSPIVDDPVILARTSTAWRNPAGAPPERGPLAMIASACEVEAGEGGKVEATFATADPKRAGKQYPALITSTHGKGRVVYFAAGADRAMFFYPDSAFRRMIANACRWAAGDSAPPVEVQGPLILTMTVRRQPKEGRTIVHLLNPNSSWGQHSIYQKLAPLPEELQKEYGYPNRTELRGTWPIREEVIPLHDVRVVCRLPGIKKATLQPENVDLPLKSVPEGVEVLVPKVEMHSMVVFE